MEAWVLSTLMQCGTTFAKKTIKINYTPEVNNRNEESSYSSHSPIIRHPLEEKNILGGRDRIQDSHYFLIMATIYSHLLSGLLQTPQVQGEK
jgi:hypothetical protein